MASATVVRDQWPEKTALARSTYWRPAQAAKAWGCRYQTARRWLLAHPDHAAMLEPAETFGRVRRQPAMLAGQERTRSSRGNPLWRDSASQTALVCRRWKRRRLTPLSPAAPPWEPSGHCRPTLPVWYGFTPPCGAKPYFYYVSVILPVRVK
ncbi:MAG: hypothetical protein GX418_14875 [Clostridiales bacterium]|nr:hypothetical protein [Clostridiales bacterium]